MSTVAAELPAPLTPEGCDLSGHEYFPLHFRRLRGSRWWRQASDTARSRNIDLWGHAFEQVPSGSLPDDDLDLAEFAGFGRDLKAFRAVKADLMGPWVLCSDGRWYHPTLCEMVLGLWERMSERRRQDRIRQNKRRGELREGLAGTKDEPLSRVTPPSVTRDIPLPSRVTPPPVTLETAPKGKERTEGSKEPVAPAAPSATGHEPFDRKEEPTRRRASPAWEADPRFCAAWDLLPLQMRRRAKSREKTWPSWTRAAVRLGGLDAGGVALVDALRRYLAEDPDVQRTGGPGFRTWLDDGRWEHWLPAAGAMDITDERWAILVRLWREGDPWGATLGPEPGQPGCRAPAHLLIAPAERATA